MAHPIWNTWMEQPLARKYKFTSLKEGIMGWFPLLTNIPTWYLHYTPIIPSVYPTKNHQSCRLNPQTECRSCPREQPWVSTTLPNLSSQNKPFLSTIPASTRQSPSAVQLFERRTVGNQQLLGTTSRKVLRHLGMWTDPHLKPWRNLGKIVRGEDGGISGMDEIWKRRFDWTVNRDGNRNLCALLIACVRKD